MPLARSAASAVFGESAEAADSAQQTAELGLASAILSWPHRNSSGFRRIARAVMIQKISERDLPLVTTTLWERRRMAMSQVSVRWGHRH